MAEGDVDKICQIFSGCVFALFIGIFVIAESSSPVQLKRLPIDVRWQGVTRICMFVCIFSCWFNFFQVTELDNVALRRETPYTLDMARPIEWMFTCPLMQLVLVILCGDRVPDYRLILMPGLSFTVLLLGVTATEVDSPGGRACVFGIGSLLAILMFFFNGRQIAEASDGEESFFSGSSEIRWLSVVLVLTWIPFPVWYALSPEGAGLMTDKAAIQVGWALLNLTAKGSFTMLVLRGKSKYFREMRLVEPGADSKQIVEGPERKFADKSVFKQVDVNELVDETLGFIGLSSRAPQLKQRMARGRVRTGLDLDGLTETTCKEARIPWELVYAMQRRLYARAFEQPDSHQASGKRGDPAGHDDAWRHIFERFLAASRQGDVGVMTAVIGEAEALGLSSVCLRNCHDRVGQVRAWQTVCEYLASSGTFQTSLSSKDAAEVQLAIDVASAVGLESRAVQAQGHLKDLTERQKACKAAVKQGVAHFKQRRYAEAVERFTAALQADPEHKEAALNRAAAQIQLKSWADVEADAARILELDPSNEKAHRHAATAFMNLGQQQVAALMVARGLAKNPGSAELAKLRKKVDSMGTGDSEKTGSSQETQTDGWSVGL